MEIEQMVGVVEPMPQAEPLPDMEEEPKSAITPERLSKALETFERYLQHKTKYNQRVIEDEQWYQMQHWDLIRSRQDHRGPEPTSAWLFSTLAGKHADLMDNYPDPVILPREADDEGEAEILSDVVPIVMEQNHFEQTYNDASWRKVKHGSPIYAVTWDKTRRNGLGDVAIEDIDFLRITWEPGIDDLQKSANVFVQDIVDNDKLIQQYPQLEGKLGSTPASVPRYIHDQEIDLSDKSVVMDWYYKMMTPDGRTLLHYCKFVGDTVLYASEDDPACADGYYQHGLYPFVLDPLFPEIGNPAGFGYIQLCKSPQLYIDALLGNILESSMIGTKRRFFVSDDTNINTDDYLDVTEPLVKVAGRIDDTRIKEITTMPISHVYMEVLQGRIDEMKDTSGTRDVNSGGVPSGVTAASAIAALQEAGNKTSRDMISASYRADVQIVSMVIELLRQFQDQTRSFRIVGEDGQMNFIRWNNANIVAQQTGKDTGGSPLYRLPEYDIKIKAQRRSPFSQLAKNEMAKEFYGLGFFNPQRAQESLTALGMMEFDGKDQIVKQVQEGETLWNMLQQAQQQLAQMAQIISTIAPGMGGGQVAPAPGGGGQAAPPPRGGEAPAAKVQAPQPPSRSMAAQMARTAPANINKIPSATAVRS